MNLFPASITSAIVWVFLFRLGSTIRPCSYFLDHGQCTATTDRSKCCTGSNPGRDIVYCAYNQIYDSYFWQAGVCGLDELCQNDQCVSVSKPEVQFLLRVQITKILIKSVLRTTVNLVITISHQLDQEMVHLSADGSVAMEEVIMRLPIFSSAIW